MGRLVPRAYFAPLRGAAARFGRWGILARGAAPLDDPANEAQALLAWGSEHEQEVNPAPRWKVGALPSQGPQLARPQQLCWRGRPYVGAPSHLNSYQSAVRITR